MPKVFFVIIAWNSAPYIDKCLSSIFECENFESDVIVVDNGSNDDTPRLLDEMNQLYSNFSRTTLSKNVGTTISRNIALQKIPNDCDFVCILDSDTVINDLAFVFMIDALKENPDIGIIGPTMSNFRGEMQLSGRNLPTLGIKLRKAAPLDWLKEKGTEMEIPVSPVVNGLQDVPYLLSACWLMPAKTLDIVGLFDEKIFYAPEDVDYCLRAWQHGLRVVRCWYAHIIHEYQRLSHKNLVSRINIEHVKGLVYYFRKHGYLFDSDKAFRKRLITREDVFH